MLSSGESTVPLRIAVVPTSHPEARRMLADYYAEIRRRFGFGVSGQADAEDMDPPGGRFLIAYEDDRPVASGGIRTWEPGVCEIKRMFVVPEARRRGYGRQLLAAVERVAAEAGFRRNRPRHARRAHRRDEVLRHDRLRASACVQRESVRERVVRRRNCERYVPSGRAPLPIRTLSRSNR